MLSKHRHFVTAAMALAALAAVPAFGQADFKALALKHLKTSREFTLKVAGQMPEGSYDFKLTPPQMSFAEQMVHLSQAMSMFVATVAGESPNPGKPASMAKKDVVAFMGQCFDRAIQQLSKVTPEQLAKTYNTGDGAMTGMEAIEFMFDHTTHHRASAEMYLRAKGITPTEYEF